MQRQIHHFEERLEENIAQSAVTAVAGMELFSSLPSSRLYFRTLQLFAFKPRIKGTRIKKSTALEAQLTHKLLTVPNLHKTGKLQGMLCLHESMVVRLTDVLAPKLGLVKDKVESQTSRKM